MVMPERSFNAESYRYGFNGKESDNDGLGGGGSTYDYGFRIYNPGIARFLSEDPLTASYPFYSPYQFAGNLPIWAIDLDGQEPLLATDYKTLAQLKKKVTITYVSEKRTEEWTYYSVTLVHKYKNTVLTHTLNNTGFTNDELKTFVGKVELCIQDPFMCSILNSINNMSYRAENSMKMAFGDMPDKMIGNLKNKPKDAAALSNTMLHVTGQALITAIWGAGVADVVGDMHERDQKSLMTGDIKDTELKQAIDNYCDLVNNEFGQLWGKEIADKLKIGPHTTWTDELTANFLNELQDKFKESLNLKFDKKFSKDDQFVKDYTKFINENK